MTNSPAVDWTTEVLKNQHANDTYTNTSTGGCWRFQFNGATLAWEWGVIEDTATQAALALAALAKDTADGKRRVFVTQPTTPYDVGDLWSQGSAGELMRCISARLSGAYVAADWDKAVKYTDDTAVNDLQIGARNLLVGSGAFTGWTGNGVSVQGNELRLPYDGGDRYTFSPNVDAAIGKTITVSFKVKVLGSSNANAVFIANFGPSQVAYGSTITDTYSLKSFTYIWTGAFLIGTPSSNIPGAYLCIKDVKVEIGNKATDWTEAPEDVDARIQDQEIYAEFSIDGSTLWHTTFVTGDLYMRQKKGSGDWSAAIRIVGENGSEGRYTDYQFSKNTSATTAPTTGWQDAPPAISEGEYVWMRKGEVVPPATEPVSWSAATRITGDKGDPGTDGIGTPGADGVTYYTWIKYATTPTTGMSDYPDGKLYLGIAYNKITATESDNYADYSWSLIKGTDGQPGTDGVTTYTWIKYADTPTTGMSDSPTGKTYIGLAVNKTTATESTTYADYTWSLIKGADGVSVTATDVEFSQSTSATTAPTTGWQSTAPAWEDGKYIWTRTKTTYSSGDPTYSAAINPTGSKGTTGGVGTGVDSMTEEYYLSTSKTTQSGGSWATTPPTWSSGKYVWTRVKIVYTNPASTVYTTPVVSSEWEAVNEIQIGGRNLLLNSATFGGWSGSGFSIVGNEGRLITDGGDRYVFGPIVSGAVGKLATVSLKAKIVGATGANLTFVANFGQSHQAFYVGLSSTYQVFSFTYLYTTNFLFGTSQQNIAGGYLYIKDVKVEIGNKATDYTPAPEDVAADYTAKIAVAQAKADEAAAVTSKFGTDINGGLITAIMMKLRDPLTADGAEMAGMNGGKGNGSNPAFWAGGNYTQALQDLAAIIFRHSGAAKIGELHIEENGVITIKDAVTGQIRLMFNASELPLLSTLLDSAQITGSQYNSGVSLAATGSSIRPNTLTVTQANSKLSLVGGWSIHCLAPTTGTALVAATIYILKDGVFYTSVKSVNYTLNFNNSAEDLTEAINFSLSSVPTGVYSVAVSLEISEDGSHDTDVDLTLDDSTLSFVFEKDIKQVRFGTNGQMIFYGVDKYFYQTEKAGGPFIKSRGEWDIPGLRGSGSVASGGGFSNGYGKASNSAKTSTGLYTITHSLGHINYGVNLTIVSSNGQLNAVVTAKNTTSFDVRIVNASNNTLTDSAFDFSIYGNE